MLLKFYFKVVRSSDLDNTFYDLFCHAYIDGSRAVYCINLS